MESIKRDWGQGIEQGFNPIPCSPMSIPERDFSKFKPPPATAIPQVVDVWFQSLKRILSSLNPNTLSKCAHLASFNFSSLVVPLFRLLVSIPDRDFIEFKPGDRSYTLIGQWVSIPDRDFIEFKRYALQPPAYPQVSIPDRDFIEFKNEASLWSAAP